jgi:hypothetical protein
MDPAELGGFLRPRVPLMVTCITNGRDELETPAMEAIAFIQRKLPPKHAVGVVAPFLDPSPVGCESTPERGSLRAFVSATNGVLEEICTPNWVSALERIGKNAFGYRTDVFVQGQPAFERASLRVWIDDLAIPSIDPDFSSRIWEWNPVLNAVSFEPLYSPEPGRRVTIRYTPACTY